MKLVMEQWRQFLSERSGFTFEGSEDHFRVDMDGIGYAQGGQHLGFKECQSDVDALMKMPEFREAQEKFQSDPENVWGDGERKKFRPRLPRQRSMQRKISARRPGWNYVILRIR